MFKKRRRDDFRITQTPGMVGRRGAVKGEPLCITSGKLAGKTLLLPGGVGVWGCGGVGDGCSRSTHHMVRSILAVRGKKSSMLNVTFFLLQEEELGF